MHSSVKYGEHKCDYQNCLPRSKLLQHVFDVIAIQVVIKDWAYRMHRH